MVHFRQSLLAASWILGLLKSIGATQIGPYIIDASCDVKENIESTTPSELLELDIKAVRSAINNLIRIDLNNAQESLPYRTFFTSHVSLSIVRPIFHSMWSGPVIGQEINSLYGTIEIKCLSQQSQDSSAEAQGFYEQCKSDPSASVFATTDDPKTIWVCDRLFTYPSSPNSSACPVLNGDGKMVYPASSDNNYTLSGNRMSLLVQQLAHLYTPFTDTLGPAVIDIQEAAELASVRKTRNLQNYALYFAGMWSFVPRILSVVDRVYSCGGKLYRPVHPILRSSWCIMGTQKIPPPVRALQNSLLHCAH